MRESGGEAGEAGVDGRGQREWMEGGAGKKGQKAEGGGIEAEQGGKLISRDQGRGWVGANDLACW